MYRSLSDGCVGTRKNGDAVQEDKQLADLRAAGILTTSHLKRDISMKDVVFPFFAGPSCFDVEAATKSACIRLETVEWHFRTGVCATGTQRYRQ